MADREERATDEARVGSEEHGAHPFWPNHVINQVIQFYLLFGLLIALCVLLPFGLHGKADPLVTPENIKPEWYFLPMYQAIKYFPEMIGLGGAALVVLGIIVWPFIDAAVMRRWPKARGFHTRFVTVMLVIIVGLGILGKLSGATIHVLGRTYRVNAYGVPGSAPAEPGGETGGGGT
jgi:quinol-cytochrome oxidoreductase complex cytochrome b subunit